MSANLIYVTAATAEKAVEIGRAAVESRLAACANVLPGMTSVYRWEGKVQEDSEAVLILKTRQELVADLVAKVKELHDYDCPCVVVLPISGGNDDFIAWIVAETS